MKETGDRGSRARAQRLPVSLAPLVATFALAHSACDVHVPIATPNAPRPRPAPVSERGADDPPVPGYVHGEPDTAPPELDLEVLGARPEGAVVRPTLFSTEGTTTAGSAFACRLDAAGPVLLCTAHHLFGPAGGLSRDYAWDELPALVDHVEGAGFLEEPIFLNAHAPLALEGAAPMEPPRFDQDLAVLRVKAPGRLHVLELGAEPPAKGERVYLVASLQSGPQADALMHPAEVIDADTAVLAYRFADPTVDLRATSGAPIVDGQGVVVGIHLAGAYDDRDRLLGVAVPASAARRRIAAALHQDGAP